MGDPMIFALFAISFATAYGGIAMYVRFALAHHILDMPVDRSSHTIPTPRGAGIVFAGTFSVAVVFLGAIHCLGFREMLVALTGLPVGAVGYWDDRCEVRLGARLAVQMMAACSAVFILTTIHMPGQASSSTLLITVLLAIEVLGLTWSLNLTNFMDGIDGIVTVEAVTVTTVCAALIWYEHGATVFALLFALLGISVAPFIFFNWAPAKIFMGDAGSGFIGFMLGVLILIAVAHHQIFLLSPMILMGVFISDATTTLVARMLRHERWSTPHRTHAYQILAQSYGHKRVTLCVGVINLVWLTPLAIAAEMDAQHGVLYLVVALTPLVCASYLVSAQYLRNRDYAEPMLTPAATETNPRVTSHAENKRFRRLERVGLFLHRYSSFCQLILIALFTIASVYGALLLHYDGASQNAMRAVSSEVIVLWSGCQTATMACFRLHRSYWRFTSAEEVPKLVVTSLLASAIGAIVAGGFLRIYGLTLPEPVYLVEALVSMLAFIGLRVGSRLIADSTGVMFRTGIRHSVLICSADLSGVSILSEIRRRCPHYRPVGFIDNRIEMKGRSVCGLRVLGSASDLKTLVKRHSIHQVLIGSKPAADIEVKAVREQCRKDKIDFRVVTSFAENDLQQQRNSAREFAIEELLGRPPVSIDASAVAGRLKNRVLMVTGAAGSIGSELCRQIAAFHPSAIIGYDISETALFFLEREFRDRFPSVPFLPCIGSVQNGQRLSEVLAEFRPEVVYHAAAYKHVPLMEQHLFEAIENNIAGTQTLLRACEVFGVRAFVMISTDKAVRPTSLMGATKRVAELIVRASSAQTITCVSTRFGNVLGSSGSVIPIFRSQILAGGPVKVTHPSMVRYFMTIPEAAQLVLQASCMGKRNEIYVLAMGEPVRIVDLADRMIRLMGYSPGEDIAVEFTGMRPGEKLHEELNAAEEETVPTSHPRIFGFRDTAIKNRDVLAQVEELKAACEARRASKTLKILQSIVSDYTPSKELLTTVTLLDEPPLRADIRMVAAVDGD
jgi:FlaA1/EpsC-like NDP-sugar epimerase/UDP-N-acetylmuramyl pentapeptide phosphotransferase/UDP-N-acetylglucosamine-1-phosphate transferase